jgi:hypothetical protein
MMIGGTYVIDKEENRRKTTEMMGYQPWRVRVVVEGIDDALIGVIYVVYRKNKRREKGSKNKEKKPG